MYLLLAFAYQWIAWQMTPLIPFLPLITYPYRLKNLILLWCFWGCLSTNPGAVRKLAWSNSYASRYTFWKFSNISGNNKVSLWTYKLWYSSKLFILKSLQTLFACTQLGKNSKSKDHFVSLEKCLKSWEEEDISNLLHDRGTIQERTKISEKCINIEKFFLELKNMISKENVNRALKALT